ncbi:VOC family protein [Neisseria montereyensis]|uniref:VOC family protein n=1 Tax=Neisseria montereyensis TaxID=2973938 RepID=A0ABT2FD80_9NEIS|nr:VOC family protein [Neisseria montereyensis]MCS4533505.1 VOC family protein [Neisseria montereyensis]
MEQHIHFITLGVADIAVSRRFYQDIFGWQPQESRHNNVAFFQAGGALMFALYPKDALAQDAGVENQSSGGFSRVALAHNVRSREEVDTLFKQFAEHGVTITQPPQDVFWGGYCGYIADPDGFLWEICYNPFLEKSTDTTRTKPIERPSE